MECELRQRSQHKSFSKLFFFFLFSFSFFFFLFSFFFFLFSFFFFLFLFSFFFFLSSFCFLLSSFSLSFFLGDVLSEAGSHKALIFLEAHDGSVRSGMGNKGGRGVGRQDTRSERLFDPKP